MQKEIEDKEAMREKKTSKKRLLDIDISSIIGRYL